MMSMYIVGESSLINLIFLIAMVNNWDILPLQANLPNMPGYGQMLMLHKTMAIHKRLHQVPAEGFLLLQEETLLPTEVLSPAQAPQG